MKGRVWRVAGVATLIVAIVALVVWRKVGFAWLPFRSPAVPESTEPPATPAELAVVAPLRVGAELDGWEVVSVSRVLQGSFHLVLAHSRARMVMQVALAGSGGPRAPCVVPPYAVYYSSKGARKDDDVGLQLSRKLCVIVQNNRNVPPPPGLTSIGGPGASASQGPRGAAPPPASAPASAAAPPPP